MKRKNVKRIAGALAAVMMMAVVATGCGNQGVSVEETSKVTGSEKETSKVASSEEESTEQTTNSSWVSEKPIEVSVMVAEHPNQAILNDAPAHEEIFKKTNVKLDFQTVPQADYAEKKNVVLASNNFADIIYLSGSGDLATYGTEGLFEPLMQYVNEETMPNFYKLWQENPELQKYLVDGELYGFPKIKRNESAAGTGPVIRMDLLEENNIPVPGTWDELLDALIQLKEIYPDSTPWAVRNGTNQLLWTTAYSLGSGRGMYYDYDEGKYIFGPASENFKEVLSFLNRAYEAGVLDPEYVTATGDSLSSKMCSGQSFFYEDNTGFCTSWTASLNELEGSEDAKLMVIPVLENSFGQRRAIGYAKVISGEFFAINAGADNIEEIIKLIDWMYSEEGSDISNYGVEGVSFEYDENGEPQYIEDYVMQYKDGEPDGTYATYASLGVSMLDFSLWSANT